MDVSIRHDSAAAAKKGLRAAFKKAISPKAPWYVRVARTLLLALTLYPAVELGAMPHLPGRPLTGGERTELRQVFKNAVDTGEMRIHHSAFMDRLTNPLGDSSANVTLGHTRGSTIITNSMTYQKDYCAPNVDDMSREVFLHESVHVWQHQSCPLDMAIAVMRQGLKRQGGLEGYYEYKLAKGKDLLDFNIEQQAVIITDYYLHIKKGDAPEYCQNAETGTALEGLYTCTLAKFTANPAYLRNSPKPLR